MRSDRLRSRRRWGHGRLFQSARYYWHELSSHPWGRWSARYYWHELSSHPWGRWNIDPPEDERGLMVYPEPMDTVFVFRGCRCGALEQRKCPYSEALDLTRP